MLKSKKSNPFPPELFVSTEFRTADDKSRFGRKLAAFVLGGFRRDQFAERLYTRLCNCFGHIAEYDRNGFYATWFADAAKQRQWVEHILKHVPCGDPHYTFSDLERLFKAWLGLNREKLLKVIAANEALERQVLVAEDIRRDALAGQPHQAFKVVAKSQNKTAFGHNQFIMLAKDGTTWAVCHIQCNGVWKVGDVFNVPLDQNKRPKWEEMSVECPERREHAPQDVVTQFWNGKVT